MCNFIIYLYVWNILSSLNNILKILIIIRCPRRFFSLLENAFISYSILLPISVYSFLQFCKFLTEHRILTLSLFIIYA